MGLKLHWLHSWMISDGNRMEIVYSFLLFSTCRWLSIPSTMASFWAELWNWGSVAQFCAVSYPSSEVISNWCWWAARVLAYSPCFVGCHRVRCCLCFFLTFIWNALLHLTISGFPFESHLLVSTAGLSNWWPHEPDVSRGAYAHPGSAKAKTTWYVMIRHVMWSSVTPVLYSFAN